MRNQVTRGRGCDPPLREENPSIFLRSAFVTQRISAPPMPVKNCLVRQRSYFVTFTITLHTVLSDKVTTLFIKSLLMLNHTGF